MTAAVADEVIDKAIEKIRQVEELVQKLYDGVNEVLSWVPDLFQHLIEPIKKGIEAFGRLNQKIFEEMNQFLTQRGSPSRLREVGRQWTEAVAKELGTVAGDLKLDKHRTNIEWEGRAAEAYKALVPGQVDAVNGVKSAADRMVLALDALANAIEMFWISVGIAVTTFVVGMVGAVAACCGIVTAPAGVAAAAGVASTVLGLITAAITAVMGAIQPINSQVAAVHKQIGELGDKWAKPDNGVDLGDGSSSDGDESNWEAR